MKLVLGPALSVALFACSSPEPQAPAPRGPAPSPTVQSPPPPEQPVHFAPPPPEPTHPVGAVAIDCTVRAEIEPTLEGDNVRLRFVLRNIGPSATTVTLRDTCPGGVVELTGLPAGFDPMHRCRAGACLQPATTRQVTIPGGHTSVTLGETVLAANGDACNPPLPLGSTFLQASVTASPQALEVCSGAQVHLVRDPQSRALRLAGLLDEPVPATPPRQVKPKPAPKPKQPAPTVRPGKNCPVCAFGCPRGVPSRKVDANGCRVCACEDLTPTAP